MLRTFGVTTTTVTALLFSAAALTDPAANLAGKLAMLGIVCVIWAFIVAAFIWADG
jgi:hypothetical protein